MNTAQHHTKTITRHEVRIENTGFSGLSRRDISDFIVQTDNAFKAAKGRPVQYDDDYYVTGDEEGLTAVFETEETR